jgi:hypothetical protein
MFLTIALGSLLAIVNSAPAQDWTPTSAPGGRWFSVATSADGIKLVAAASGCCAPPNGVIYVSADSGVTWKQTTAPINNWWTSVACSTDGTKLMAVAGGAEFSATNLIGASTQIWTSTDSGATWTQSSAPGNRRHPHRVNTFVESLGNPSHPRKKS